MPLNQGGYKKEIKVLCQDIIYFIVFVNAASISKIQNRIVMDDKFPFIILGSIED